MSWRLFAAQSLALVLLAWLAGQYLAGQQRIELEEVQEQLAAARAQLEQRLDRLERRIHVHDIAAEPPVVIQVEQPAKETQRLEALEARERALREKLTTLLNKQQRAQYQPEPVRVQDWLAGLDAEKRAEVQTAYRAELERMQNTFPAAPNVPPPSPEDMHRLLDESRERLKLRLQGILSGEDYQAFLNSLEEGQIPLGLPLLD